MMKSIDEMQYQIISALSFGNQTSEELTERLNQHIHSVEQQHLVADLNTLVQEGCITLSEGVYELTQAGNVILKAEIRKRSYPTTS